MSNVDSAGAAFINLDAKVLEGSIFSSVKVRSTKEGYVVTLPTREPAVAFTPRRLDSFVSYAPVVQILQEEDEPADSEFGPTPSPAAGDGLNSPPKRPSTLEEPVPQESLDGVKAELLSLIGLAA
jgi:hypothetical protein